MISTFAARLVDFARGNAVAVTLAALLLTIAAGVYAAANLGVDTDLEHMLPTDVGWRRDEIALDRAFPQNINLLVVVIDGDTGDVADHAARTLANRLRAEPQLFTYIRQPDGGEFFD